MSISLILCFMDSSIVTYQKFAPIVARVLLAFQFGVAAYFKLTMFSGQVVQTAAMGVPLPQVAVGLALILEIAGIVALLSGYKIRLLSFLLAGYVMLLGVIFYHNWSDMMNFGLFVSHLGLTAALLYVSVCGAKPSAQTDVR